jgi:hypothetical protein
MIEILLRSKFLLGAAIAITRSGGSKALAMPPLGPSWFTIAVTRILQKQNVRMPFLTAEKNYVVILCNKYTLKFGPRYWFDKSYFKTPPLVRRHNCNINLYWMEVYYVIIFLRHAAKYSIKRLVFNASLHSKSQKMNKKPNQTYFQYFLPHSETSEFSRYFT